MRNLYMVKKYKLHQKIKYYKRSKVTKQSHAFNGCADTHNVEILNCINSESLLKRLNLKIN